MDKTSLGTVPPQYRKKVQSQLNAISNLIQTRREKAKLTQEELAEQLGISAIMLQFIEQRRRYPSISLLLHICAHLGIEVQFK